MTILRHGVENVREFPAPEATLGFANKALYLFDGHTEKAMLAGAP